MDSASAQFGTLMPALREMRARRFVLLWMSLMLLAQVLIPIQSHSRLGVDGDGMVVEICTLQGVQHLVMNPHTGELEPQVDEDARSAAMDFSLLMAEAVAAQADVQPAWLALLSDEPPPAVIGTPSPRSVSFSSIRAPPALI